MAASKRLIVCGGNGFLGSRICKSAVARGWDVTSISRSGEPRWNAVTSSSTPPDWAHKVSWERADVFQPAQYRALLRGADYVVHSMGILFEADYKGLISGKESPLAALRKAVSSASPSSASSNPLKRGQPKEGGCGRPQAKDNAGGSDAGGSSDNKENKPPLTYEAINRDSALLLAREADAAGVRAFAYVSAAAGAPVLPARYITTKREAETAIAAEFPRMRAVFARSPLLYDTSRALTLPMAGFALAGSLVNGLTGGVLGRGLGLGALVEKPLAADRVAEAVVEALSDKNVRGLVEVKGLEELANKAWRQGML